MPVISRQILARSAPGALASVVEAILGNVDLFAKFGLVSLNHMLAFLSTALEETGGLTLFSEGFHYSAERAAVVFPSIFPTPDAARPFLDDEVAFANRVYSNRKDLGNLGGNDGSQFRGRGLIQITGRRNYKFLADATNLPLIEHPELVIADANILRCSLTLFVRFPEILKLAEAAQWRSVWALVGSGRANGPIINLPAHEEALATISAAYKAEGSFSPDPASAIPTLGISPAGLFFIEAHTTFQPAAQLGPSGAPTLGYGTTVLSSGRAVRLGQTISRAEAEAELKFACDAVARRIAEIVGALALTQNQVDALISFCCDQGVGAFANGAILQKLKANDIPGAANAFLIGNGAPPGPGGTVSAQRREDERALFLDAHVVAHPLPDTRSPAELVTKAIGFRDLDADVIVTYDASEAVVGVVEMTNSRPDAYAAFFKGYPNLNDFGFAKAGFALPPGARTVFAGASAPASAVAAPPLGRGVLLLGARDSDQPGDQTVKQLQARLIDLGYKNSSVDGAFGPATDAAVRSFQSDVFGAANADGLVGPLTWAALWGFRTVAAEPQPAPPPAGSVNSLRLTRTGEHDQFGAEVLELAYFRGGARFASLNVCSGGPHKQIFRTGAESPPGSFEPLPEGRWAMSDINWADGPDNYAGKIWNDGLGPAKIELTYQAPGVTRRSEIEMHIDWNRKTSPGTAGCVGLLNVADYKVLAGWIADTHPKKLFVDWGLGTCPAE